MGRVRGPGGLFSWGTCQGRDQMDQMAVLRFTFYSSVECFQLSLFLECCILNVQLQVQSVDFLSACFPSCRKRSCEQLFLLTVLFVEKYEFSHDCKNIYILPHPSRFLRALGRIVSSINFLENASIVSRKIFWMFLWLNQLDRQPTSAFSVQFSLMA